MKLTYEAKIYPINMLSRGRECLAARDGCRASLRPADVDLQTVFAST